MTIIGHCTNILRSREFQKGRDEDSDSAHNGEDAQKRGDQGLWFEKVNNMVMIHEAWLVMRSMDRIDNLYQYSFHDRNRPPSRTFRHMHGSKLSNVHVCSNSLSAFQK
jgi:hypothetical protein